MLSESLFEPKQLNPKHHQEVQVPTANKTQEKEKEKEKETEIHETWAHANIHRQKLVVIHGNVYLTCLTVHLEILLFVLILSSTATV